MTCTACGGAASHVPGCKLRRGCPSCRALPGQPCMTKTARIAQPRGPHAVRQRVNMLTLLTT